MSSSLLGQSISTYSEHPVLKREAKKGIVPGKYFFNWNVRMSLLLVSSKPHAGSEVRDSAGLSTLQAG